MKKQRNPRPVKIQESLMVWAVTCMLYNRGGISIDKACEMPTKVSPEFSFVPPFKLN